jgi:DNA-binding CsgD family transcriptional regulator
LNANLAAEGDGSTLGQVCSGVIERAYDDRKKMKPEEVRLSSRTEVRASTLAFAVAFFAIIVVLIGFDIVSDYRAGTNARHIVTEGFVMALALVGVVLLWSQFRSVQHRAKQLDIDLQAARKQAELFKEEAHDALSGLGEAIDRQFTRWSLSPAECEVGLLLLKGLSHKEIAKVRSTNETTVRQQALALYRKSGLASRAELSAFFLEDLLLPPNQRDERSSNQRS